MTERVELWYPHTHPAYRTWYHSHLDHFNPEERSSMLLWNACVHPQNYVITEPSRPQSQHSLQCKPYDL